MKSTDFYDLCEEVKNACLSILSEKTDEYKNGGDCFANFKRPCALTRNTPAEVWLGYWCKGTTALYDHVSDGTEIPDELIYDSINYLALLPMLVEFETAKNVSKAQVLDLFRNWFDECVNIMKDKELRYAKEDSDRLGMFKRSAEIQCTTPEKVLVSYMVKHTNSIICMVREDELGNKDLLEEKTKDHVNYLLLLNGLLTEKKALENAEIKDPQGELYEAVESEEPDGSEDGSFDL